MQVMITKSEGGEWLPYEVPESICAIKFPDGVIFDFVLAREGDRNPWRHQELDGPIQLYYQEIKKEKKKRIPMPFNWINRD
jgi:hypothetical protein